MNENEHKQWEAALLWCGGLFAMSLTVLLTALVTVGIFYKIPPTTLSGIIEMWIILSLIVAYIPATMVFFGVAHDSLLKKASEKGRWMLSYGNPVGWVACFWRRVVMPAAAVFNLAHSSLHLSEDDVEP